MLTIINMTNNYMDELPLVTENEYGICRMVYLLTSSSMYEFT